jgi:hypothetical protein
VVCAVLLVAYRFLSISTIMAPTTMIATIMPIVAGTRYMSAMDAGVGTRANFISEIKRSVTPAMMEKCATHVWT